MDTFALLI